MTQKFNIVDVDNNIIEENISFEQAEQFITNMSVEGTVDTAKYFFYPEDEVVLQQLLDENHANLKFFKTITE